MLKPKLLFVLCLVLFCLPVASFSEETSDLQEFQNLATELNNQSSQCNLSSTELEQITSSLNKNSQTQEETSNNQSLPSLSVREYLANARQELEALKTALMESSSGLTSMKAQLESCLQNLSNAEKALQSNKEDTANAIEELGNLYNEYLYYKELVALSEARLKKSYIAGNIIIPTATIPMMAFGGILMATNNDLGKPMFYTSAGLLLSCELVWNGGHLVFKLW